MCLARRCLNVIVPGDVPQCKRIGVPTCLGQKRMPRSMQSGAGMCRDVPADSLNLGCKRPGCEWTHPVVGAREGRLAAGSNTRLEDLLHFTINDPSPFAGVPLQAALNRQFAAHSWIRRTQSFMSINISLRQIPECRARIEANALIDVDGATSGRLKRKRTTSRLRFINEDAEAIRRSGRATSNPEIEPQALRIGRRSLSSYSPLMVSAGLPVSPRQFDQSVHP
jgi:hypothetical protein